MSLKLFLSGVFLEKYHSLDFVKSCSLTPSFLSSNQSMNYIVKSGK